MRRAKRATEAEPASLVRGWAGRGLAGASIARSRPSTPFPRRRPLVREATSASMDASLSLPSRAVPWALLLLDISNSEPLLLLLLPTLLLLTMFANRSGGGED